MLGSEALGEGLWHVEGREGVVRRGMLEVKAFREATHGLPHFQVLGPQTLHSLQAPKNIPRMGLSWRLECLPASPGSTQESLREVLPPHPQVRCGQGWWWEQLPGRATQKKGPWGLNTAEHSWCQLPAAFTCHLLSTACLTSQVHWLLAALLLSGTGLPIEF